jgi:hypothetical protein
MDKPNKEFNNRNTESGQNIDFRSSLLLEHTLAVTISSLEAIREDPLPVANQFMVSTSQNMETKGL